VLIRTASPLTETRYADAFLVADYIFAECAK